MNGMIRHDELANILAGLARARPDWLEPIKVVSRMVGCGDLFANQDVIQFEELVTYIESVDRLRLER